MNKDIIQKNALTSTEGKLRACLDICMGVGKTRIALMHMMQLNAVYYVVVVPKNSIKESWINEINKTGNQDLLSKIKFVTYTSLIKINVKHIDCLYLDECQSLTPRLNKWLIEYCTKGSGKILGLTGTYPTSGDKLKMCKFYCPVVFKYTIDDAIKDRILNNYNIIIHLIELDKIKNREKKNKKGEKFFSSEEKDYEYWTEKCEDWQTTQEERSHNSVMRMKVMQSFKSKLVYAKHLYEEQTDKTILFANTQEQADYIDKLSYHSGNQKSDENLTNLQNGTINRMTAVEQLNEGITVPNLKTIIIMHSYSNNRKTKQRIGRVLRLNPDETATIHILCYKNTVDVNWIYNALEDFDEKKIKTKEAKYYV